MVSGARQPVVAILLLIAFFTVISGKPIDGLLLVLVATALAWDAGISARNVATAREAAAAGRVATPGAATTRRAATTHEVATAGEVAAAGEIATGGEVASTGYPGRTEPAPLSAWKLRTGYPRPRHLALGLAGAVVYSLTVGSFTRYSWPATAGVVGLGAGVVIVGWGGPTRQRDVPGRFSRTGVITWGSILVVGGLWELSALLGQPNFEESSYAHPTISTLTDPMLHSSLGRSVALLGWIGLGTFLVDR